MNITICPPMQCHGYSDKGTYEPFPLGGSFWGDEFMPSLSLSNEVQAVSARDSQFKYAEKNKERLRANHLEYMREYNKKRYRYTKLQTQSLNFSSNKRTCDCGTSYNPETVNERCAICGRRIP